VIDRSNRCERAATCNEGKRSWENGRNAVDLCSTCNAFRTTVWPWCLVGDRRVLVMGCVVATSLQRDMDRNFKRSVKQPDSVTWHAIHYHRPASTLDRSLLNTTQPDVTSALSQRNPPSKCNSYSTNFAREEGLCNGKCCQTAPGTKASMLFAAKTFLRVGVLHLFGLR